VIDLGVAHRIASYDKLGSKALISSAKYALFRNTSARMTKERCEAFFEDHGNFVLDNETIAPSGSRKKKK
jgi:hypothetical protein